MSISPLQIDFLRLLGRTGFATTKHLEYMSIGKNPTKNSQSHLTKTLLGSQYIGRISVKSGYGIGQKTMYYLTKRGASLLAELDGENTEHYAYTLYKGGVQRATESQDLAIVRADFPHKEKYISTYLAFERYLQDSPYRIERAHHYYHLAGDRGTTLTLDGRNFRPDGIFFVTDETGQKPPYAYIVEIHRHSSRAKIITQLKQHVLAFKAGSMAQRFGITHPYFILSIYTNENAPLMRGVIEELKREPDLWVYVARFFLFAQLEDIQHDLYAGLVYHASDKKPLPLVIK